MTSSVLNHEVGVKELRVRKGSDHFVPPVLVVKKLMSRNLSKSCKKRARQTIRNVLDVVFNRVFKQPVIRLVLGTEDAECKNVGGQVCEIVYLQWDEKHPACSDVSLFNFLIKVA